MFKQWKDENIEDVLAEWQNAPFVQTIKVGGMKKKRKSIHQQLNDCICGAVGGEKLWVQSTNHPHAFFPEDRWLGVYDRVWFVECKKCGRRGNPVGSTTKARNDWNKNNYYLFGISTGVKTKSPLETNILPCSCKGSHKSFQVGTQSYSSSGCNTFLVACYDCGKKTTFYPTKEIAIEKWNELCTYGEEKNKEAKEAIDKVINDIKPTSDLIAQIIESEAKKVIDKVMEDFTAKKQQEIVDMEKSIKIMHDFTLKCVSDIIKESNHIEDKIFVRLQTWIIEQATKENNEWEGFIQNIRRVEID